MQQQRYWASVPTDEIAENVAKKWKEYQSWLTTSNQAGRIRKQYAMYYNLGQFGLQKDGSLSRVSCNLFRNVIDHIAILVSQNKLAYECAGRNTDSKSLAQARVGREYLEFLGTEKQLDTQVSSALLHSLILTESWLAAPWDSFAGYGVSADPDTGETIRSGQQVFDLLTPFQVARDTKNPSARSWVITKRTVNKWNLAALYPKQAEAILSAKRSKTDEELNDFASQSGVDEDSVDIFQLYHESTPAMPKGRQTTIVGDAVLEDMMLKYESIPVVRLAPSDVIGSTAGTSPASDQVGLQQAFDKLLTAITSNQMNLSLTSVYSRHPITLQRLAEGFGVVNAPEAPQALNLGQSNPEAFSTLSLYQTLMDKTSGVPEIARGVAPQGVTAASAMSLMLSQAIAFASPISRRYAEFCGSVATVALQNMKRFCKEEVLLSIAGKSQRATVRKVKGDSFSELDRVVCTISNPVSQTQQGREAIADKLLAAGKVDGRRYVEILNGAPVEVLFEDEADELSLINGENELLREGGTAPVLRSDNHPEHRNRHRALLNSPILRRDPKLVAAVLAHIEEHERLEAEMSQPPATDQVVTDPSQPSQETRPPLPERLAGVKPSGLPDGAPAEAQAALDTVQNQL